MRFSLAVLFAALSLVQASPLRTEGIDEHLFDKRASNWAHFGDKARTGKVTRGVNLGGWFILESWMTPSLFNAPDIAHLDVPDEWSFMAAVTNVSSRAEAKSRMKNHWNTWITEQDFAEISAAGLNSVRIPIGYWAFNASSADIEPYQATAQRPYLRNALRWANKYKLDVVLDLHGAPSSQNGADHSGHSGAIGFGTNPTDIPRAIDALVKMVKLYVNDRSYGGVVKGIEVVNEPLISKYRTGAIPQETLVSFYQQAYSSIRAAMDPKAITRPTVILSDAFTPLWDTKGTSDLMPFPSGSIASDAHLYEAFYPQSHYSQDQHIDSVCGLANQLKYRNNDRPTIVGEWSLGTGVGCSNYKLCQNFTMSDSIKSFNSAQSNIFKRRFFEAQASTFEKNAGGWIWWNWKTEAASDWSYKDSRLQGWIPKDVSKPSSWAFVPSTNSSSCVSPTAKPNQKLTFATQSDDPTVIDSNPKVIAPSRANGGYSTEENQVEF